MIKEINVATLQQWLNENKDFQLIDVREPHEKEIADIGGELIPLGTVPEHIDAVSKDKTVVVYCRSGKRSAQATQFLQEALSHKEIYNLEGGILDWADKIDNSITKY